MVDQRLCACGSGLRAVRCCAMDFSLVPPPEAIRPLVPLVERAVELHRQGAVAEAERLCLEVLELAPTRARRAVAAVPDPQGGRCRARRRRAAAPHRGAASQHLLGDQRAGAGPVRQGRPVLEAEIHARNAVRIAPENPQSHNLMGMIMTEANRPQIGEYHYRRVLELTRGARPDPARQSRLEPEEPGPHGRRRARSTRKSVAAAPEVCQTLLGWARLEEADRNFDARGRAARPGRAAGPERSQRAPDARRAARPQRRYDEALAILDRPPARTATAVSAPTSCWRRAGCSTRSAATTRRWRRSRKASGCAARSAAVLSGRRGARSRPSGCAASSPRAGCAILPRAAAARRTCRSRSSSWAFRAPARRWSSRRCRRIRASPPATNCRSINEITAIDAAHAGQPAGLSRGAGRAVDGRPARGARRICATTISQKVRQLGRARARAPPGSPTRCR